MAIFRGKQFNADAWEKYMRTLPSTKENALIRSAIFTNVNKYKSIMSEQAGGYFVTEPIKGRIGGTPVNYDGATDIKSNERPTYKQTKICFGRANAWGEHDFTAEVTGTNFMAEAGEVKEYWEEEEQKTVLSILKGIFSMTGGVNGQFVNKHTYDISSEVEPTLGADSLNKAAQKALGDKKSNLEVLFVHSAVSTNLEGLNLINFLKYTDKEGIERDLTIGTYNGKLVVVDDDMPVEEIVDTEPVYSTTVSTAATAGDKIEIEGVEYTFVANDSVETGNVIKVGASGTASQQATNIAAAINNQASGLKDLFTVTSSSAKVVFTAKSDTAPLSPSLSATKGEGGSLVITNATDIPAVVSNIYTSYMFKNGFFEYEDLGVLVPSELDRDAKGDGGHTDLISRIRKMIVPTLISYTDTSKVSPENTDFEDGSNWEIVNDGAINNKLYVDDKLIPIVRIKSRG